MAEENDQKTRIRPKSGSTRRTRRPGRGLARAQPLVHVRRGLIAVFVFGPQLVRERVARRGDPDRRPARDCRRRRRLTDLFTDLALQMGGAGAHAGGAGGRGGRRLAAAGGLAAAPDQITPKLERISPAAGFKRLFSARAVIELLKGIAKLIVVGAVAGSRSRPT